MGLLSGDAIRNILSRPMRWLYEDATLEVWAFGAVRNAQTGTFPKVRVSSHMIKVQRDTCTENHRRAVDYTMWDVRFLIMQQGVSVSVTSECEILYRGERYKLFAPIEQDAARTYWDARARLMGDE